jgi:Holliday junction resolvase
LEGHVQAAIVAHLERDGWTIEREADTASHEPGIDVLASRDGRSLAVEVDEDHSQPMTCQTRR